MSQATLRFRRQDGIVRREVGSELLLFDPRNESLHVLNPSCALVWEELSSARTGAELAAALQAAFEVDSTQAATIGSDVDRILQDLSGRGLVREDV